MLDGHFTAAPIDDFSIRPGEPLDDSEIAERELREYENRLLNRARIAGHGFRDRRLDDLELLGLLQHHGAATRLTDFTTNAFIALWFACQARPDEYGTVFGVALDDAFRVSTEELQTRTFAQLLADAEGRISVWMPAPLSPRMPAQARLLALVGRPRKRLVFARHIGRERARL